MSHDVFSRWGSSYSRPYKPPGREQIREHRFEDQGFRTALTPTNMGFPTVEPHGLQAQIEWRDGPEAHVFKAHLPGVKPHEVRVELEEDDRVLCVTTEKKTTREEMKDTWHHIEYSTGRFVQRLKLPENARADHVRAYMDNGVLTITVPKYEVSGQYHQARRPRMINISGH